MNDKGVESLKKNIILLFVLFTFSTIVYAEKENIEISSQRYDSAEKTITFFGDFPEGPDRNIVFNVYDSSENVVCKDVLIAGDDGIFTVSVDVSEYQSGEYTFSFKHENANEEKITMAIPPNDKEVKIKAEVIDGVAWMNNLYDIDGENNSVYITLKNAKMLTGRKSLSDYYVDGLPEGIKTSLHAENETTLKLTLSGTAVRKITEDCELILELKGSLVYSGDANTSSDKISGITLICEANAKRINISGSGNFYMGTRKQPKANTGFEVFVSDRRMLVDGILKKGEHFDYSNTPEGLEILAVANAEKGTIEFTLTGKAEKDVTKDIEIENFFIKKELVEGSSYDSDIITSKIVAVEEKNNGGSSGGNGGGSGSGGGIGGMTSGTVITGGTNLTDIIKPTVIKLKPNVPVAIAEFDDIENHWGEGYIETLAKRGIVQGKSKGMFFPNDTVTRAEFVTMIVRCFEMDLDDAKESFKDVDETNWYYKYVAGAEDVFVSKSDYFRPNDNITREEMAKVVVSALLTQVEEPVNKLQVKNFGDSGDISDWAVNFVETGMTYGIINGDDMGNFNPKNNATRAEAAAMIFRMFDYVETKQ